MLTPEDYEAARNALEAVNVSGLVLGLAEIMPRIWDEAKKRGKGTDYVNRHPITKAFASQIKRLTEVE